MLNASSITKSSQHSPLLVPTVPGPVGFESEEAVCFTPGTFSSLSASPDSLSVSTFVAVGADDDDADDDAAAAADDDDDDAVGDDVDGTDDRVVTAAESADEWSVSAHTVLFLLQTPSMFSSLSGLLSLLPSSFRPKSSLYLEISRGAMGILCDSSSALCRNDCRLLRVRSLRT